MSTRVHAILPSFAPMGGITLFGHILIKPGLEWLVPHEEVHVAQQEADGFLRFAARYAFSAAWRVKYEAPAYAVEVLAGTRSLRDAALALSGPLYLRPCSYDAAYEAILAACRVTP